MFTQNFYNLFRAMFTTRNNHAAASVVNDAGTSIQPYKMDSSSFIPFSDNFFYAGQPPAASITTSTDGGPNPTVVFGTGTSPATLSDYKLENKITSGLSASVAEAASNTEDTGTLIFTYTLTNTSSNDITIGEIGYRGSVPSNSTTRNNVLLDRTVLDNPVTIPAGSSATIVYVIEYGLPVPPA